MALTLMGSRPPPTRSANSGVAPNQTLYVSHLPDTLQKADLRRCLYCLFTTYGPVLDIVAMKTMKMRGQAHIVYKDVQCAAMAMRALNGFEFFGKEIRIQYARSKSDTIAKLDGTFKIPTHALAAPPEETGEELTATQKAIFNAPAFATTGAKQIEGTDEPKGVKRTRDEEEQEEEDDDDEGSAMEESDDED